MHFHFLIIFLLFFGHFQICKKKTYPIVIDFNNLSSFVPFNLPFSHKVINRFLYLAAFVPFFNCHLLIFQYYSHVSYKKKLCHLYEFSVVFFCKVIKKLLRKLRGIDTICFFFNREQCQMIRFNGNQNALTLDSHNGNKSIMKNNWNDFKHFYRLFVPKISFNDIKKKWKLQNYCNLIFIAPF